MCAVIIRRCEKWLSETLVEAIERPVAMIEARQMMLKTVQAFDEIRLRLGYQAGTPSFP
jgi:hypothetical protein